MDEIKLKVEKGNGDYIGNLLRKVVLSSVKSVRPVGFIIYRDNKDVSPIMGSDKVIEDTLVFSSNLSELDFSMDSDNEDILSVEYSFTGTLMSDDLTKYGITCNTKGKELLHSIDSSAVTLKIIYRNSSGCHTTSENREAVSEHFRVVDMKTYNTCRFMSSRHSCVDTFSYRSNSLESHDDLILKIKSNCDIKEVLTDSCSIIINNINGVLSSLKDS